MTIEFFGVAIEWRGPAPFVFVPVPAEASNEIKAMSAMVTYGWGVIPVTGEIGRTAFTTSLFPRNNVYFVPIKAAVQRSENVKVGDTVHIRLHIDLGQAG